MEIQTGFRLVQNDELRLIDKGTGDEHHLQFTAAHPVAVLVGKAGDPHPFHHGFRHFNLLFAGLLKGPKMCTAPQQNHFQTSVGKSEAARLRNVGDGTPDILRFEGVNVLPVKQSLAAVPWQQTDHALEQGGFTNAVWTKNRKDVTFFQAQIDIFENHRLLRVAEATVLHFQDHCRLLLVLFSREINAGAPMIAVRMERGSSIMLMLRDRVSIRIIKLAPRLRLRGTT